MEGLVIPRFLALLEGRASPPYQERKGAKWEKVLGLPNKRCTCGSRMSWAGSGGLGRLGCKFMELEPRGGNRT